MDRELCAKGLIPGPNESEEHFLKRVKEAKPRPLDADVEEALQRTKALFGVAPDWVPIFYSNKNLAPWEAAACWIDDENQPIIQMRYAFQRKRKLWGLFDKVDVLTHELLHACRSHFEDSKFEEFLAYQSGPKWKAILGTSLQSPKEAYFFLISVALASGGLIYANFYLLLPMSGLLILAFFRTWLRFDTWKHCKAKLPPPLLFRLSDKELQLFAKLSPDSVKKFIENQDSFRWKVIRE